MKVVHDPIHGSVPIDGVFQEVADRHEMQRLRYVRQLGMGFLVFPGANHTRFEHSLGVYHLAGRMADAISLSEEDSDLVRMAGLLHDMCHSPFSHSLEATTESITGMDHMELARAIITGKTRNRLPSFDSILDGVGPIGDILDANGIPANEVCDLIEFHESRSENLDSFTGGQTWFRSRDYAHQIIHGPVDADQMDYLMRDAHYTGMTHGDIDCERLINTMAVHNDRIVINRGGIAAAEGLMVSRSLMYTSVYFHETVKIAERMLVKAVDECDADKSLIFLWNDSDLMQCLLSSGGRPAETAKRILTRDLYKKAAIVYAEEMTDDLASVLMQYSGPEGRDRLEKEVADAAGVDVYEVAAEVAPLSNIQSLAKIGKTDVAILDSEGRVKTLTRISPIAKALQSRDTNGWSVMVSCPEKHREKVRKAACRILGIQNRFALLSRRWA